MEKARGRRWEVGKVKKSGIRCRVKGARLGSWRRTGNLTSKKQFTTGNGQLALLSVVSGYVVSCKSKKQRKSIHNNQLTTPN